MTKVNDFWKKNKDRVGLPQRNEKSVISNVMVRTIEGRVIGEKRLPFYSSILPSCENALGQ
jgi:hypothetical protein